MFRTSPDRP